MVGFIGYSISKVVLLAFVSCFILFIRSIRQYQLPLGSFFTSFRAVGSVWFISSRLSCRSTTRTAAIASTVSITSAILPSLFN